MSDERFYIGELAQAAGVKPQTIRYYERKGLLGRPPRSRSGYRLYDEEALARYGSSGRLSRSDSRSRKSGS